jgi:UDP:flavonoid glycosyltransferase YjiC (YdhE family)
MHHGGAGTTACGLRHGRPTIIVPFFGDQKFWGEAVHRAGAGPAPIPIKTVSAELFAAALAATKTEAMRDAAAVLGEKIRSEKGEMIGVESFQRHLPLSDMR